MKKLWMLILVIIMITLTGCKMSHYNQGTNSENTNEINKNTEIENHKKENIEVKSDCGDMDCFEKKFFECKPSNITTKINDNLIYFYEIIGQNDSLCKVKSKFKTNPNPYWVNKEMVCLYNNNIDFEEAIQNTDNCVGELYDLMTGKINQEQPSNQKKDYDISMEIITQKLNYSLNEKSGTLKLKITSNKNIIVIRLFEANYSWGDEIYFSMGTSKLTNYRPFKAQVDSPFFAYNTVFRNKGTLNLFYDYYDCYEVAKLIDKDEKMCSSSDYRWSTSSTTDFRDKDLKRFDLIKESLQPLASDSVTIKIE